MGKKRNKENDLIYLGRKDGVDGSALSEGDEFKEGKSFSEDVLRLIISFSNLATIENGFRTGGSVCVDFVVWTGIVEGLSVSMVIFAFD